MRLIPWILLTSATAGLSVIAWSGRASEDATRAAVATPSALPSVKLLFAQSFQLAEPRAHAWRRERPSYDAGWLLVLETDASFCEMRSQVQNVLYAGDTTLERVNQGFPSGRIVAILPSARDANGEPVLDLRRTPIWWGAPALPERIDAHDVALERARAIREGASPRPLDEVARAQHVGGVLAHARDHGELRRLAAELMLAWTPGEEEQARSILVPLLR